MQLPDERLDLLIACLKRTVSPDELMRLRLELMTDDDALHGTLRAAQRRRLTAALIEGLKEKGIIHPAQARPGEPVSLRTQLGEAYRQHLERRAAQADALKDVVRALNAANIVPLIIKGAVSLLTGEPSWRFQRDLDFAIAPDEAEKTMEILEKTGFTLIKATGERHHHLDCMARGDPPVFVEPHLRVSGLRALRVLGGVPLIRSAVDVRFGDLEVRLLRPEHALLHGMAHHHYDNRGNNFGLIGLKGLMEFAHGLGALDEEAAIRLMDILRRWPRLRGATELWIAASDAWLGVPPPHGLDPGSAARRRLARIDARLQSPEPASMGAALHEELSGVTAAIVRSRQLSWRVGTALAATVFDSVHNRPWGGRQRAIGAAGYLASA